ncbi:MAG: type IX secretion system membrane protein PorP/SprF [Mariniphaga sp.]
MNDRYKNITDRKRQLLNKSILILLIIIICGFATHAQQDPQFSQNRFNQLSVNPGFAGSTGLINMSLLNRYQWVGFPGAPVTTVFNADASFHLIGSSDGIGLSVINDVIGFEKNVSVGLNYSWRTQLGNGRLGSGISLGLMNKNLNFDMTGMDGSDLINQSDPALPKGKVSGVLADLGIGLYYQHKDYELGISARHLNQPTLSFDESGKYSLRRHYYLSGIYTFQMADERLQALPSFFLKTDATTWQADINMTVQYDKRLWGGIGYRPGDAIIINMGAELWNGIKFGYSYDMSTSAMSRYNAGSHEFFLAYSVLLYKKRTHQYKSVRFL